MITSISDLVDFLKRHHRDWLVDPSVDPDEVPVDLPRPLATIYREVGALIEIQQGPENNWRAPFATQDALMPVDRLKRIEDMVEFAWENQGNWSARCALGAIDPPVYSNAPDIWNEESHGFVVVCDSLNHFLTTLCLQEAVMSCRNLIAVRTDDLPNKVLTVPLQPLWLDGHYVSGAPDHQFFVSQEHGILVMHWAGIWVGSNARPVGELVAEGTDAQVLQGR